LHAAAFVFSRHFNIQETPLFLISDRESAGVLRLLLVVAITHFHLFSPGRKSQRIATHISESRGKRKKKNTTTTTQWPKAQ
jgi:hypothetical protein